MAIKDWKKEDKNAWFNHTYGLRLVLDGKEVEVEHYNQSRTETQDRYKTRNFKTKSEALKFAKSYMRKH